MRGSREISLVPSLHRASTDALISILAEGLHFSALVYSVSVGKLGAVSNLDMGCSQDNTERFPNAAASLTILIVDGAGGC